MSCCGRVRPGSGSVEGVVKWIFNDPEAGVADLASSPAVVGNRVYTGSAQASVLVEPTVSCAMSLTPAAATVGSSGIG